MGGLFWGLFLGIFFGPTFASNLGPNGEGRYSLRLPFLPPLTCSGKADQKVPKVTIEALEEKM